jgi:transposase
MSFPPTRPNAENCTLSELDTAMQCAPTQRSFVRMMAIRSMIVLNLTCEQAAVLVDKTKRAVSNWIKCFNQAGIDGLIDAERSGRPREITPDQSETYEELIRKPEKAGQTHWTAVKFHGYIRKEFEHEVGYSTLVRWLHEKDFRLKVPQPWPDRQNEEMRQEFLKQLRLWLNNNVIELWYLDETGVEGDPRPRRRWAKKGEKTRLTHNGDHMRMNAIGMVCPRTGDFYALEVPYTDSAVFQTFLTHANADVSRERPRNFLICDNASWHKVKSLDWGAFEPVYLPAYSPDLNPIERLWLLLKAEWFSDFIAEDREHLEQRLEEALKWLIQRTEGNKTTCVIKKEL